MRLTAMAILEHNISKEQTGATAADLQWIKPLRNRRQLTATLGMVWLDSESPSGQPSFYLSPHVKFLSKATAINFQPSTFN